MDDDTWLNPLLPLILARTGRSPLLELGCGSGRDTAVLSAAGCQVVGIDQSAQAIATARERLPACEFHCQDIRAPFPRSVSEVNVILASLSLHYFDWDETVILVERIRGALGARGLLVCRLNSTNDIHHGAMGHPEIGPHYHLVEGQRKRFFDANDIEALFVLGWRTLMMAEKTVQRYERPKSLWELVLQRAD